MNRTRFVVVGAPRTGTSLMIETLDAHPQIRCYGGIFNRGSKGALDPDAEDVAVWLDRLFTSEGRLDEPRVVRPKAPGGPHAVGFKVHYDQWSGSRARAHLLEVPELRIVHVVRDNLLRVLVSAQVAAANGRYQSRGAPSGPPDPVHIDFETLEAAAEDDRAARARLEADFGDHPRLTVEYGDWKQDRTGLLARVQAFLQVEAVEDLSTDLVKTGTRPLSSAIANYAALRARVQGTALARFFEPD